MTGDSTDTDWNNSDFTDPADRSLVTDISETLAYMSSKNRAERRRQKLREELVREYIENTKKSRSSFRAWLGKLFGSE
jgi:hypothetical protein